MAVLHLATTVAFPASTAKFVPTAVGFFGLGTGYLIYGPQELFGFPKRDKAVDLATGIWGIWMPGFMQFLTGVYRARACRAARRGWAVGSCISRGRPCSTSRRAST
jgi:hypothetical protein